MKKTTVLIAMWSSLIIGNIIGVPIMLWTISYIPTEYYYVIMFPSLIAGIVVHCRISYCDDFD